MRTAASKIGDLAEVAARAAGQRVALVTGHFEVITAGVVRELEAARAEAEVLVVAVRRRPDALVCDDDRALLVAALRTVDHVLLADDDSLDQVSARLAPDVRVSSPDEQATRALLERLRR